MNDYDFSYIGKRIRYERQEKNISREELAIRSLVSVETIRKIEKNLCDPNVSTLIPICRELSIDISRIFFDYPNSPSYKL